MLLEKPRVPIRQVLLYGLWPGFFKIWLYRLKGYKIGKGVRIGFGSVICAKRVEVGDHTSIGFLTIIRGKEIRLGPHVRIGSTAFLDSPIIEIGEGTKINEQVFVGGLQFPDSRFVLGRNCQVMQMSFINPGRSIVVGDDSGIGGHCLIFGHSSWLSKFEGYDVDFASVEIGRSVALAWRVFVLPRTKIGDGSVIGANSVVHGVIPPRSMAVGFPARVISRAPEFPKQVSDEERVGIFRSIVDEMIRFFAASSLHCEQQGNHYKIGRPARRWSRRKTRPWVLLVEDGDVRKALGAFQASKFDVFLSLREIPGDIRDLLDAQHVMWIEIEKKEQSKFSNDLGDEISLFLTRYGVRTLRSSWESDPGQR